ncbi:MAG: diguanylate cyclase (GGDEF)-like protein, partial [Myxococcota bacterium]
MTVESTTGRRPTVLLVEPRISDARNLRGLLTTRDAQVTHVEDWAEAHRAAASQYYDLVLAASSLPECRPAERLKGKPRIVVMVDPSEQAVGKASVAAGAAGWITKNFSDGERLRKEISAYLIVEPTSTTPEPEDFQAMVAATTSGLVVLDANNVIRFANLAAGSMLGDGGEVVGTEFTHPATVGPAVDVILAKSQVTSQMQVVPFRWRGAPCRLVTLRDGTLHHDGQIALKALADRLGKSNLRLERLASCDSLTELPNRRGLEAAVSQAIGQVSRTGDPTLAALIDCDDFKKFNTDMGHAGGDLVLKAVADRLRDSLRPADHVGRLGGDEFLVILPDTSMSVGMAVAQRLRMAVSSKPIEVGNHQVRVTVSVGVVKFPTSSRSLSDVVAATRVALLHSKAGGKDRVATNSGTKAITRAINGVVRAIAKGEGLRTLAQPLYGLQTRKIVGYELLTRGPTGDFESPDAFFRLALQERILHQADLRCLDACVAASASVPEGRRVHLNMFPT